MLIFDTKWWFLEIEVFGAEPSPESFQWGGLCVCVGGFEILNFDKNTTDL